MLVCVKKCKFSIEKILMWMYNVKVERFETSVSSGRSCPAVIDIVLVEPEIPMNTGNIARTCAATGARLHLIEPLGFDISDKAVKRAGLDYWHLVDISVHTSIEAFLEKHGESNIFLATTKAPRSYAECDFSGDVTLIFGKETAGLPKSLREKYYSRCIRIPMRNEARSLNLSNSVAILCFEALRQQGFPDLEDIGEMKGTDI
jgi:rRNA methylase, putative, group 2